MASVLSRRLCRNIPGRVYSTAKVQGQEVPVERVTPPKNPTLTKLPNGVTVVSIENASPVSRVAVALSAGARFESPDLLGVTHCLRVASGLSTQKLSAFALTRTVEQMGGNFTCSSTREHIFYKIEFLRDNLDQATQILRQVTSEPAFKPWELADIQKQLKVDLSILKSQHSSVLYDLLHQASFRNTLGNSLYAPEFMIGKYNTESLLHYMKTYYSSGRVAVVGVGVNHDLLVAQAKRFTPFNTVQQPMEKAKFHEGGELRLNQGGELTYAAVAFEGPGLTSKDLLAASLLQNLVGVESRIKYSQGTATSRLACAASKMTSHPFSIATINANYTDSGLFGFTVIAAPRDIEKVLRAAYGQLVAIAKNGVTETDVARAKSQLKVQIAMYYEDSDSLLFDLGEQALGSDEIVTASDLLKLVDSIAGSDISKVAKKIVEGKRPSMAAVGNLAWTPYLDQIVQK